MAVKRAQEEAAASQAGMAGAAILMHGRQIAEQILQAQMMDQEVSFADDLAPRPRQHRRRGHHPYSPVTNNDGDDDMYSYDDDDDDLEDLYGGVYSFDNDVSLVGGRDDSYEYAYEDDYGTDSVMTEDDVSALERAAEAIYKSYFRAKPAVPVATPPAAAPTTTTVPAAKPHVYSLFDLVDEIEAGTVNPHHTSSSSAFTSGFPPATSFATTSFAAPPARAPAHRSFAANPPIPPRRRVSAETESILSDIPFIPDSESEAPSEADILELLTSLADRRNTSVYDSHIRHHGRNDSRRDSRHHSRHHSRNDESRYRQRQRRQNDEYDSRPSRPSRPSHPSRSSRSSHTSSRRRRRHRR